MSDEYLPVLSRLTMCCPSNGFSHEFFISDTSEVVTEHLRGILEDQDLTVLTLSTEESQFVYPLDFVRQYCFIRIDSYGDDEYCNDKPPGGKIISIDFKKKN